MTSTTIHYRPDIDGLRACAVLPVLLFHSGSSLFRGGFVGVDIFFVISGYLISRILSTEIAEQRFSILRFYERRARRILPALFVVIAACFLVGYRVMLATHFDLFAQSAVAAVLSVSNIFFWKQSGYFAPDVDFAPLLHTWSLGVEEQFYLLFPLLLLLLHKARLRFVRALPVLLVLTFLLGAYLTFTRPFGAFFLLPARAWELLLGATLGVGAIPSTGRRTNELLGAAGLAAIIGSILLIDSRQPFPGFVALFPCLGTAALLHSGAQATVASRLLSARPLVFVGLISYSLYLWHWPVFSFARMAAADVHLDRVQAIAAIMVSLVLAALSWRFVERPFRDSRRWPARGIALASVIGGATLVTAGVYVHAAHGVPERLSRVTIRIQAAAGDIDPLRDPCLAYDERGRAAECRFGPGGVRPSYVVVGDSHAAALRPAIEQAMATTGREGALWWHHGCSPLLGMEVAGTGDLSCDAFRARVMADLRRSPEISTVFIAGRWSPLLNGILPEIGDTLRMYLRDDQTVTLSAAESARVFERSADRTVRQIRAMGKQVIVVGDVPAPGFDVPSILALARLNGAPRPAALSAPAVRKSHWRSDAILSRVSARYGALYIPLLGAFCTNSCALERDGRPLFSDNNHISLYAARELVGPFLGHVLAGSGGGMAPGLTGRSDKASARAQSN